MDIKPETVKKLAYPALAAVAALSACEQQPQRVVGKVSATARTETELQRTGDEVPQPLGGDVPAPIRLLPDAPTPPEDTDQGIPGEPPIDSSRIQPEE